MAKTRTPYRTPSWLTALHGVHGAVYAGLTDTKESLRPEEHAAHWNGADPVDPEESAEESAMANHLLYLAVQALGDLHRQNDQLLRVQRNIQATLRQSAGRVGGIARDLEAVADELLAGLPDEQPVPAKPDTGDHKPSAAGSRRAAPTAPDEEAGGDGDGEDAVAWRAHPVLSHPVAASPPESPAQETQETHEEGDDDEQ